MAENSLKNITIRALKAIFWMIVLCILVNLLFSSLQNINPDLLGRKIAPSVYTPPNIDEYVLNLIQKQDKLSEREIVFTVKPGAVDIDLRLVAPIESSIGNAAQNGQLNNISIIFWEQVFGYIQVLGNEITPEELSAPIWTLDKDAGVIEIKLHATKNNPQDTSFVWVGQKDPVYSSYENFRSPIQNVDIDRIQVILNGAHLAGTDTTPDRVTSAEVVYLAKSPSRLDHLVFNLSNVPPASSDGGQPQQRRGFLTTLDQKIQLPWVGSMLYSVVEILPILIFLYFLRKRQLPGNNPFIDRFGSLLVALALFHFLVYFFSGLSSLYYELPFLENLSKSIGDLTQRFLGYSFYGTFSQSNPYNVAVILFGVILPTLFLRWNKKSDPDLENKKKGGTLSSLILSILWLGLLSPIFFIVVVQIGRLLHSQSLNILAIMDDIPLILWIAAFACLVALVISRVLLILIRLVDDHSKPGLVIPISVWLLILMAIVKGISWRYWNIEIAQEIIWFVLTTLFGGYLLYSIGVLIAESFHEIFQKISIPAIIARNLWILVFILAIPLNNISSIGNNLAYDTILIGLIFAVDNFIMLAWLAGICTLLYDYGRRTSEIGSFAREIGLLAAAYLLFPPTSTWLYIPITFLLGWAALNYLVHNEVK